MSRFVTRSVERFDLGDGDWVDLLVKLSYLDRSNIEQKLLAGSIDLQAPKVDNGPAPEVSGDAKEKARAGADKPDAEIAIASANLELLKRAIVAWGGPGFTLPDGTVAPITEAAIGALDETAEKILNELERRMVKKPKEGFTPPPSPPTSTAGAEASTEAS